MTKSRVRPMRHNLQVLQGVPSYHYDPVFAQQVMDALAHQAIYCVALELPPCALPELMWGIERWPQPVASLTQPPDGLHWIFPFIPGDSILEAGRIAHQQGVAIHAVDVLIPELSAVQEFSFPDPQWAKKHPHEWQEAIRNCIPEASPPHAAREAEMSFQLQLLLDEGKRVLWVGGAAHWHRILERLKSQDFAGRPLPDSQRYDFQRVALDAGSLSYLSGRAPNFLKRYADAPWQYDEMESMHALAVSALFVDNEHSKERIAVSIQTPVSRDVFSLEDEVPTALDAARVVKYARNLTACSALQSTPGASELLRAGEAVVGPLYAGRIYQLLSEMPECADDSLPRLTYQRRKKLGGVVARRPSD